MPKARIPSPARSEGAPKAMPRRHKPQSTRSVGSPARSTASGRLSSVIDQFKEHNRDSFPLSPFGKSVLTDNTDIEQPRRASWYKKVNNSRDVTEVLDNNDRGAVDNNFIEELDFEVLSQEKKDYSMDIPDSSGSESISSIVRPQRKLFTQKENAPQKRFSQIIRNNKISQERKDYSMNLPDSSGSESISSIVIPQRKLFTQKENVPRNRFSQIITTRESLTKQNKTNIADKTTEAGPRNLFSKGTKRSKPVFPAALLNFSPVKTANKTKGSPTEVKGQARNLFGNHPVGTKRKNMFADFILSESEDDISDIQPKLFAFQQNSKPVRHSSVRRSSARLRENSLASSFTTDIEIDDWKLLPSSTMVEHQIEAVVGITPGKTTRLSKLSEAKEVTNSTANKTKQLNQSNSKNQSKTSLSHLEKSKSIKKNVEESPEATQKEDNQDEVDEDVNQEAEQGYEEIETEKHLENSRNDEQEIKQDEEDQEAKQSDEEIETEQQLKNSRNYVQDEKDQELEEEGEEIEQEVSDNDEQNESQEIQDEEEEEIVNASQEVQEHSEEEDYDADIQNESAEIENEEENEDDNEQNESAEIENKEENEDDNQDGNESADIENEEENEDNPVENQSAEMEHEEENEDDNHEENESAEIENEEDQVENQSAEMEHEEENEDDNQEENESAEIENDEENEDDQVENQSAEMEHEEENEDDNQEENESAEIEHEEENEDDQVENQSAEMEHNEENKDDNREENESAEIENEKENEDDQEEHQSAEMEHDEENEDDNQEQNESAEIENEEEYEDDNQEENKSAEIENEQENEDDNHERNNDNDQEYIQGMSFRYSDESQEIEDEQEQNEEEETEQTASETPNVSHDTTGRNRNKDDLKSPEAILHSVTNPKNSFIAKGRNTSVTKTESIFKHTPRPSLAPIGESTGFSDGTKNSSAEGSGWDSHRTTRKTLRQTFGRDFTPRKSLRALVMEKSAKRQTAINEANAALNLQNGNPSNPAEIVSESIQDEMEYEENIARFEQSDHEVSQRTRQTTLEMYLQEIKKENIEKKQKIEQEVRNSLKFSGRMDVLNRIPSKPYRRLNAKPLITAPKKRMKQSVISIQDLPPEFAEDLKYKPPRRYQLGKVSWVTKRLYNFLETKLEPKYNYKARVRAEKLVQMIYEFSKDVQKRKEKVASPRAVAELKHEMARLDVVRTHFEFYNFFHDYMPLEVKIKVVPDIINNIPLPINLFGDIIETN